MSWWIKKQTAPSIGLSGKLGVFVDTVDGLLKSIDDTNTVSTLVGAQVSSSGTPADLGTAARGTASTAARADHVHGHGNLAGGALHANATSSVAGFTSSTDKASLDSFIAASIFVNVKDYGATGDGSHDDLANINSAITAVPSGTTLYFPAGTYKITGTINVPAGKSIRFLGGGDGKSTIITNHGTLNMVTVGDWNTRFDDISFDASVSRTGGYAIDGTSLNGGFYIVKMFINNCSFNAQYNGVGIDGTLCYVNGCQFTQTVNFGIQFNGPNVNSMIHNTTMDGSSPNAVAHIEVNQCGSLLISNCDIIRATSNLRINPTSPNGAFSIYAINTFFDTSPGSSVKFMGTGNIQRAKFVNCWFSGSVTGCEFASTATTLPTAIDFVNCDIFSNSAFGILLNGVQDISVSNSRIAGNATAGIRTNASSGSVTKFNLQDNTIGPTAGIGANGIGIDIVAGTYGGYNITGNDVRGNTSNLNIQDAGSVATGDLKKIGDNLGHLLKGAIASIGANVATSGIGETLLLSARVPPNSVAVGQQFRIRLFGNSSSTGTLAFKGKAGPNGTVADTAGWTPATSAAQVANHRAEVECLVTVKTIGSSGAVAMEGRLIASAVLLETTVGAPANVTVNTQNAWFIDITCACSVGAYTALTGVIEAL